MLVGVLILDLYIPASNSLKDKRGILKRLKDRIRNKFNVSVSEIDDQDVWRRAQLAVAHVANRGNLSNSILSQVVNFVEREHDVQILDYRLEFL